MSPLKNTPLQHICFVEPVLAAVGCFFTSTQQQKEKPETPASASHLHHIWGFFKGLSPWLDLWQFARLSGRIVLLTLLCAWPYQVLRAASWFDGVVLEARRGYGPATLGEEHNPVPVMGPEPTGQLLVGGMVGQLVSRHVIFNLIGSTHGGWLREKNFAAYGPGKDNRFPIGAYGYRFWELGVGCLVADPFITRWLWLIYGAELRCYIKVQRFGNAKEEGGLYTNPLFLGPRFGLGARITDRLRVDIYLLNSLFNAVALLLYRPPGNKAIRSKAREQEIYHVGLPIMEIGLTYTFCAHSVVYST